MRVRIDFPIDDPDGISGAYETEFIEIPMELTEEQRTFLKEFTDNVNIYSQIYIGEER